MDENIIKYKFALLGDSQVGKTSFFRKLFGGTFSNNVSTIGIDSKTFHFEDIEINLDNNAVKKNFDISLYDTAGQERFRSITKNYINGTDGIIIIYDITNRESFEHVENWLNNINDILSDSKSSKYLIVLLGNKLDLTKNDDNLKNEEKKRKVAIDEGKKKCEEYGFFWGGECSVKELPVEELKKLFKNFLIKIYEKVGIKSNSHHINKINKAKTKKKRWC